MESFEFFKQQCELYFSVRGIDEDKQVDYILLLSGKEGLRRYNSWSFANEADRRNPSVICEKFLQQLEPQINFRIARFSLQNYAQNETENIDDFLARCRRKALKCKFTDEQELEERIIDQLIVGTRFTELQKQLLSKNETMTIEEVLNMCRSYGASIEYMKKMSELQRKNESQIIAFKHRPERSNTCSKCGLHHQHGYCPAQGSTCSACGRKNHWAKMCQQARKKKQLTGSHKQTGLSNIKNLDQPSLHLKTGRAVLMFRTRCVTNLSECLSIQCVTTKKEPSVRSIRHTGHHSTK